MRTIEEVVSDIKHIRLLTDKEHTLLVGTKEDLEKIFSFLDEIIAIDKASIARILKKLEDKHTDISGNTSLAYFYSEGFIDALIYAMEIVEEGGKG